MVVAVGLLWVIGCKPIDPPKILNTEYNPLVWKVERDRKGLASNNYFYKDLIIQGTEGTGEYFKLTALSADSGVVVWENTDWRDKFYPYAPEDSDISSNILVATANRTVMAVELDSGKTIWTATIENPSVCGIRIIGDWAYKSDQYPNGRYSAMYRFNIYDGTREEVFRITRKEHGNNIYEPNLKLPVKWTTPHGDELLVMHNRSYGRGVNGRDRMDILAYNLTADSMEWYRQGIDESSSSSGAAISGNNVYFYGMWHAYCINPANGDTKWKYNVGISSGGDFNTANILIAGDKLIVKQENFRMTALNKETGEKIWYNPQTAPSPHLLTSHEDTIWMASGGILAIDANTGKVFFNWDNGGKGWWSNPVLPHPNNGNIYTTDGAYIYCLNPKYLD